MRADRLSERPSARGADMLKRFPHMPRRRPVRTRPVHAGAPAAQWWIPYRTVVVRHLDLPTCVSGGHEVVTSRTAGVCRIDPLDDHNWCAGALKGVLHDGTGASADCGRHHRY